MYEIRFYFDGAVLDDQGREVYDPPRVYIFGDEGDIAEVLEDPTMLREFSCENEDWAAGPLAKRLLSLLNNEATNG